MAQFVCRTIKNGAVTIYGRKYRPDPRFMPYDGRLDGRRMVFGLYRQPDGTLTEFVQLWGTTEAYRGALDDRPECVDGALPWCWWFACQ